MRVIEVDRLLWPNFLEGAGRHGLPEGHGRFSVSFEARHLLPGMAEELDDHITERDCGHLGKLRIITAKALVRPSIITKRSVANKSRGRTEDFFPDLITMAYEGGQPVEVDNVLREMPANILTRIYRNNNLVRSLPTLKKTFFAVEAILIDPDLAAKRIEELRNEARDIGDVFGAGFDQ